MEQRDWCVYAHINKYNGKVYVGITSQNPENRWMKGAGYDKRLVFGRAIKKYGWDVFHHIILVAGLTSNEAKESEKIHISMYSSNDRNYGYNMTKGGEGLSGFRHTKESKLKMSLSKSGDKSHTYGKHLSDSVREKISNRLTGNTNALGCVRSDETKEKMSRSKYKPVASYKEGVLIKVYDSAKDAECELGVNRKNISLCCKNKRKHAGGYAWKFV